MFSFPLIEFHRGEDFQIETYIVQGLCSFVHAFSTAL